MASTISAGTTAGTSIAIAGDTSGVLQLQTNGTTAALELDTSQNLKFNSGYGSVATAYGCRAWVNFDGTGTPAIRASGNVSSITDNGTGDYTVNFSNAMPNTNYAVTGVCVGSTSNAFSMICGAGGSVLNTGSVRFGIIAASTGTLQDYGGAISIVIFR